MERIKNIMGKVGASDVVNFIFALLLTIFGIWNFIGSWVNGIGPAVILFFGIGYVGVDMIIDIVKELSK